jgi:DNA-directed RNA polymerase subunit RPC12/RpoP
MKTHKVSNGEFGVALDGKECTCAGGDWYTISPDGMMVAGGSTNMIPASQLFVAEPVRAVWRIHLFADCPNCRHKVDLCGVADWWADGSINPLEHGTPKADDYPVACPNCGHEFRIKCEW